MKHSIIDYYEKKTDGKIIFAHMANTIKAVQWALNLGVNGLEMDLRFNPITSIPSEFRHSTTNVFDVCDCSFSTEFRDNVCKHLSDSDTCLASENAIKMLEYLATQNTLAVLYVDSKVDKIDKPQNFSKAGENVIDLLEKHLFSKGYKGQVIISAPDLDYSIYINSAVNASKKTVNRDKYYFTYDGQSTNVNIAPDSGKAKEEFRKAVQGIIDAGTKNRFYSAGISTLLPGTFYDQMALAKYNKKQGVISSSGIWTLDSENSIKKYLDFGVDGILTNVPQVALAIFMERGLSLAKPGDAFMPAKKDIVITELPPGEICDSNSNCGNRSCARSTAVDNALKICCTTGKHGTYAGFDYCYGMPDTSVCWSDEMCLSGYCRGNEGGFKKGICGKLEVGESCNIDANCKNGKCGRESANDGAPKVCCRSGISGRFGGYDYCYGMSSGTRCWSDAMCATRNCKGNLGGIRRGNCI